MKSILIIGGGIIGQFSAYFLNKQGYPVTIVDDSPEMLPASHGNCGLITPSHLLPINSIKTIIRGLKWSGKEDAPLAIKPQLDVSFIKWFLSFAWHSRKKSIKQATEVRNALLQRSWELYSEHFSREEFDAEWQPDDGLVYAIRTKAAYKEILEQVNLFKSRGMDASILSPTQLREKVPQLADGMHGGAIYNMDGWLNPVQLLDNLRHINRQNGVTFITDRIENLITTGRWVKVATGGEEFYADHFVVAGGAQSVHLTKPLGIHLPMIPGKGYNLTSFVALENQPKQPVYLYEKKVVATPWQSGFRLGSTMEFSGFDLSLNKRRLEALKVASREYLNVSLEQVAFKPWTGWRPMTSNGIPIICHVPQYKNLTLATGHGMLGLSMAPATGEVVSKLVANEE